MDLSHFSQASKSFRKLILDPKSAGVWKTSFDRNPQLPRPPSGVFEANWAFMLYGPGICRVCRFWFIFTLLFLDLNLLGLWKIWRSDRFRSLKTFLRTLHGWTSSITALSPMLIVSICRQKLNYSFINTFKDYHGNAVSIDHEIWTLMPRSYRYSRLTSIFLPSISAWFPHWRPSLHRCICHSGQC